MLKKKSPKIKSRKTRTQDKNIKNKLPDQQTIITSEYFNFKGCNVVNQGSHKFFISNALPNEKLIITPKSLQNDGYLSIIKQIITPSPTRIKPQCIHAHECGGCSFQHTSIDNELIYKTNFILNAFKNQNLTISIDKKYNFPHNKKRRGLFSYQYHKNPSNLKIGFMKLASNNLVDINNCHLFENDINKTLQKLKSYPKLKELTLHKGHLYLYNNQTHSEQEMIIIDRQLKSKDIPSLIELANYLDLTSLYYQNNNNIIEPVIIKKSSRVLFDNIEAQLPPRAFLQPSNESQEAMISELKNMIQIDVNPKNKIAELFSGCGTFSIPLANIKYKIDAFENMSDALKYLQQNANKLKLNNLQTQSRDLHKYPLSKEELTPYHTVILNPPKAGAKSQMKHLCASNVHIIIYISCNPVTLARDIRILQEKYKIQKVILFNQFIRSSHSELMIKLKKI